QKIEIVRHNHRLPMDEVVRMDVRRSRSSITRREIFQKLNAWSGSGAHPGYEQMRSKDLVQMFLLGSEVFALARFAQPKEVLIKLETCVRVRNSNGRMIDAEE